MGSEPAPNDRLATYRAKRSATATPEPFGGTERSRSGIFVVQKHAATRLHYDLRLEHDGVLMSWAVPAGISLDPSIKRFAAHTEDHPLEYADFEGVIPKGEYGGGEMIVWDRGALTWDEDPDEGLAKGKLLFTLRGYKLHGQWTLVRMKKDPKEWLLIKKPDGWDRPEDDYDHNETSVYTGRTVEDLADDQDLTETLTRAIRGAGGVDGRGDLPACMLATAWDEPFSDDDWLFEIKYDGYRLIAEKAGRSVHLRYRSGGDATPVFPEIATALRRLPFDSFVIDGEVVVLDGDGIPSFSMLQRRGRLSNRHDVAAASASLPATLFVFDLLSLEGLDARPAPVRARKEVLSQMMPVIGPVRYADHFVGIGEALFDQAAAMGLEGVVAKRADSPYVSGRSDHWLKIRVEEHGTFAIVGYTRPKGGRSGIGALHVAGVAGGVLMYCGRVGSGFTDAELKQLRSELDDHVADAPRARGPVPEDPTSTWVEPTLAASVRFKEVTADGHLRQPVFEGWRELDIDQVHAIDDAAASEPPPPSVIDARSTEPTNIDKVFWPDEGYTKGDLIDYYTAVADRLLPYLADRPLVLDRYPDGIDGKSFFQKNVPEFVPDWIRTEFVGDDGKGNTYFIADDLESLRYLANLASIPLHVWASRLASIDAPDWCILDLDPKDAPFTDVVTVARVIKDVCDAMDLPAYPKTSGKTGLHVLIPMGAEFDYSQQKMLGELIARVVETRTHEIATTVRSPSGRDGKVYIDYLQNGKGKLIVGPYSVRPVAGATVSAPLRWKEVTSSLDVTRFTIRSMPRRLASMSNDPLRGVLDDRPDIRSGLAALAQGFSG